MEIASARKYLYAYTYIYIYIYIHIYIYLQAVTNVNYALFTFVTAGGLESN